jgi:hypothetical protein
MTSTLFAKIDSAVVNYETVNSIWHVAGFDNQYTPIQKLIVFLNLCQFSEYYCLFDRLYVDQDKKDIFLLPDVIDIFEHPSIKFGDMHLLDLTLPDDLEVNDYQNFLDQKFGANFTDKLISRYLATLDPRVTDMGKIMSHIFSLDRGAAIALSVECSRDIARAEVLNTVITRTFTRLKEEELPLEPLVFSENVKWQNKTRTLYLPTHEEYPIYFNDPDEEAAKSLDAGRLVRKSYGALIKELNKITDLEDEFITASKFLIPPITTAIMNDIAHFSNPSADDYIDHLQIWREKFAPIRAMVADFDRYRTEKPDGYKSKIIRLKTQINKSIKALTSGRGFEITGKVDTLDINRMSSLHASLDDFRLTSILKLGIDKIREAYDLRFIKPLPELKKNVLMMSKEHAVIKSLCKLSDEEFESVFPKFRIMTNKMVEDIAKIFYPDD